MRVLITGAAGFIGYHLSKKLISEKNNFILGVDNINDYYDVSLKKKRLKNLKSDNFKFVKADIKNYKIMKKIFKNHNLKYVINLAAQAGVRYSLENPRSYLENNIVGFFNILELCKEYKIKHLIYASTSSVYGDSKKFPLKEELKTDSPLSFYAATKKCNEIMAYNYSTLYNFQSTGLRFFTVYGPLGRPDMSLYKFANAMSLNKKIDLFNNGNHYRDFTYIDDVVDALYKLIKLKRSKIHDIYNIGKGQPQSLMKFISIIEKGLNKKAKFKKLKKQIGDVEKNHASLDKIKRVIPYYPNFGIKVGINSFLKWFQEKG